MLLVGACILVVYAALMAALVGAGEVRAIWRASSPTASSS
jgi:hypothetical protein